MIAFHDCAKFAQIYAIKYLGHNDEVVTLFANNFLNPFIASEYHRRFWKSDRSGKIWRLKDSFNQPTPPSFYQTAFTQVLTFDDEALILNLFSYADFCKGLASIPNFVGYVVAIKNPAVISAIIQVLKGSLASQLAAAISSELYPKLSTDALKALILMDDISQYHPLIIDEIFSRGDIEKFDFILFVINQNNAGLIIDILYRKQFDLTTLFDEKPFMHLLVMNTSSQCLKEILESDNVAPSSINIFDQNGHSPIYDYILNQEISDIAITKILLLIKHGANINIKTEKYNSIFDCILERKLANPSKDQDYEKLTKLINEATNQLPNNNAQEEKININELKMSYQQLANDNATLKNQMHYLSGTLDKLLKASQFQTDMLQQFAEAQLTIQAQQQIIQAQQQIIQTQQELIQQHQQPQTLNQEKSKWNPGFHPPSNSK